MVAFFGARSASSAATCSELKARVSWSATWRSARTRAAAMRRSTTLGPGATIRRRRNSSIDAVLVTELSRWGRSTTDLLATLKELQARRVSVIALNGMTFDLSTPHGRMIATLLAGIAEFERELIQERIRSGIAAAKARGKRLGRQSGQRPKSDRLAPKVLALVRQGRSYRLISRELGLSKNTVLEIVKRNRAISAR